MRRWLSGLLDRIGLAFVRRFNGWRVRDPDRQLYLESAARIGVRVAAVSSALVLAMGALVAAYIIWQTSPGQLHEHHGPEDVHVYLNARDIAIALILIGAFSIAMACVATWVIAGRAVRPLDEAFQAQRRFVADASHELRTPLAVLNARVQQLQAQLDNPERRRELVSAIHADTKIMIDIVNDMLDAAAGGLNEKADSALRPVAISAVDDMRVIAAQQGVELSCGAMPDVAVPVPEIQLRRAIVSLIDNAIDHTPAGGRVTVTAESLATRARLRFSDTGHGIVGIEPGRVFDRFAHGAPEGRAQQSHARTGYGIGLALVREIAARAGGTVRVEKTGPAGTVFLLDLPTTHEQQAAAG